MTHDRHHVRLLQNAHADWIEAQYRGMEQMPANPMNVIIRTIGPTRTFIARGHRLENRAIFTGEETDQQIADVLQHFADHQSNCVIEVNPANFYVNPPATWEKRLLERLLAHGCKIHDFRCVWSSSPLPPGEGKGEGERPVRCERFEADQMDRYVPLAERVNPKDQWTDDVIASRSVPGWRHYIVFDERDVPCANGSLFVNRPIGYLAWWFTQPSHRFHGIQQLGIRQRVRDTFTLGCDRAFTVTDFNFSSPANLQRCGFTLAYNYLLVRKELSDPAT